MSLASSARSYGQTETLIDSIRNIISDYSYEKIFSEFLQNADDAGAKRFHVIVDERSHPTDSLLSPEMRDWQGPAILIFNDAQFSQKDFQSLMQIRVGGKRHDSKMIGKFGLGFNSCYHFTDVPSFVSGDSIAFLDPQEKFLPKDDKDQTQRGIICNFLENSINDFREKDQLMPFNGIEGLDFRSTFKGTLFRIPLRQHDNDSGISRNAFSTTKILEFLNKVKANIHSELLFLRNIDTFEVSQIMKTRTPAEINRLWKVDLVYLKDDVRNKRSVTNEETKVFQLKVELTDNTSEKRCWDWVVVTGVQQNPSSEELKKYAEEYRLRALGGVSALLKGPKDNHKEKTAFEDHEKGRIFCFLPLPEITHMPVHLNGVWAQGSDRSKLLLDKDSSPEIDRQKLQWNRYILLKFLPKLHCKLFEKIVSLHRSGEFDLGDQPILNFWPFPRGTQNYPEYVREYGIEVLKQIPSNAKLFKPITGSEYCSLSSGCFSDNEVISRILVKHGIKIVLFGYDQFDCLEKKPDIVNQQRARDAIRNKELLRIHTKEELMFLLRYILADGEFDELNGIQLLPLANDTLGTFGNTYYLIGSTERALFPKFDSSLFIDNKHYLYKILGSYFQNKNFNTATNVAKLDSHMVKFLLSQELRQHRPLESYDPQASTIPNKKWLDQLWGYILGKGLEIDLFRNFPLLDVCTHDRRSVELALLNSEALLLELPNRNSYTALRATLGRLGVRFTERNSHNKLSSYILSWKTTNIVKALERVCQQRGVEMETLFRSLSKNEVKQFRALLQDNWNEIKLNLEDHELIRSLPIWPIMPKSKSFTCRPASNGNILPKGVPHFRVRPGRTYLYVSNDHDREILTNLGVPTRSALSYITEDIELPSESDDGYVRFLREILSGANPNTEIIQYFKDRPCFPNKYSRTLKRIDHLFDYNNLVFRTVYGEESEVFLHPDLQYDTACKTAFSKMGFKRTVNKGGFYECARWVERMMTRRRPPDIRNRGLSLTQCLYKNVKSFNYTPHEWEYLKRMSFVPIQQTLDVPYSLNSHRQPHVLNCFDEIILPEYRNVAWSQKSLIAPDVRPPSEVLEEYPTLGRPDAPTVVSHLRFLHDEIIFDHDWCNNWADTFKNIVSDVYEWLENECSNENLDLSLHIDSDEALFLNINKGQDPFSSKNWVTVRDLVLGGEQDESGYVKQSIAKYKTMLRSAGVQEVKNADVRIIEVGEYCQSDINCKQMLNFLQDSTNPLHDVTFVVKGERIGASRYVLAASSETFRREFVGYFAESNQIVPTTINVDDIEPESMRVLLRYLYGQNTDEAIRVSESQRAGLTLYQDLLKKADYYLLDHLKEEMELNISRYVVRSNMNELREFARMHNAGQLERFCDDYIRKNGNL